MSAEKPVLTVTADTLVSLLLFVVIRAQVRHLQARLVYIRQLIFIDDVDNFDHYPSVDFNVNNDSASIRY